MLVLDIPLPKASILTLRDIYVSNYHLIYFSLVFSNEAIWETPSTTKLLISLSFVVTFVHSFHHCTYILFYVV